ncbi:MAG: hypothetical protein DYH08_12620 [Actinobacteria bacterium ATB1]|nr:hypothetical protein [Actinobacteria bacterium ATB1]
MRLWDSVRRHQCVRGGVPRQSRGLDAVRWYLLTQGPLGNTDADFSHGKFVEVYNADLANGFGNCASRVRSSFDHCWTKGSSRSQCITLHTSP